MKSNSKLTIFAETNFRNERKRFGIKEDDRRRHMYVLGKTGVGKTTLLENMVISDIIHGNGVGVVDPHGEFAEKMLHFVPKERMDDVIYFNPADFNYPIAFNPIESVPEEQRHLVASGLMGVFKKIWGDVWSARMEYILNNTVLAILETPGSTIVDIMRMYNDKDFRKTVVSNLSDPVVRSFWQDEFGSYTERYAAEATPAIQNKIGQFLSAPLIRHIVGQKSSSFDFRKAMDEGKIIIMNLSKGRVGEDNAKLLGGLLVAKMYLAAMSRVDIPNEEDRKDFYLYVDEFQNFATESFADILSEARKYRLNLTLANQYIAQLEDPATHTSKVKDAVFGNVGTMIMFRVGAEDAEFLEKEFEPEFTIQDLVNLPKYTIYLKLMIDGLVSRAFSANTLPPYPRPEKSWHDEIIKRSRGRYSRDRAIVEEEVASWREKMGVPTPETSGSSSEKSKRKKRVKVKEPVQVETADGQIMWEAECWEGGEKILIPFKPTKDKPVYCKKHSHKLQEMEQAAQKAATPEPISLSRAVGDKGNSFKKNKRKKKKDRKNDKPDVDFDELRKALADAQNK